MIFFIIFAVFIIIFIIFLNLNIKIEIQKLKIVLPTKSETIINKESKILLKIYLIKKIKIAEINLKDIKINDQKFKERMNKLKNNIKIGFDKNSIKYIKNVDYKIEKLNLKLNIGLEDAAYTAISVGIIAALIANIIRKRITNLEKNKYEVIPVYQNSNNLKLEIEGIFTFNIVNIKDIVKFLMKGRVEKDGRTSNRRPYAYSNE